MSFATDPKGFFYDNACVLQGGGQFEPLGKATAVPEVFSYDTVLVDVATAKAGPITNVTLSPSTDPTVQYLPYRNSELTYTKVSGAASVFITGPLTGCNVYIANKGDGLYAFHVNANKHDTNITANVKYKRELFFKAAASLGINTAGAGAVERTNYSATMGHPVDGALVFGVKDVTKKWKFYFSGFQISGKVTLFFALHVMNEA